MKVLVAYATKHGATRGIAERVAATLEAAGLDVTFRPVDQAGDVSFHDAFVVGGAAYFGKWLREATEFVRANEPLLRQRPTWLFSSGPVGTERVDKKGHDVVAASIPVEFGAFETAIQPREEKVFFGAMDLHARPVGLAEGLMTGFLRLMPAAREAMPSGDFRDWPEIEAWAQGIARELAGADTAAAEPVPA